MAARDHEVLLSRLGDDLVGVGQADRQRLFDVDRLARRERGHRALHVDAGRRGHGDHVAGLQELVHPMERPAAERHGQGRGAIWMMRVEHRRQNRALGARIFARVVSAEDAGADHAAFNGFAHGLAPTQC